MTALSISESSFPLLSPRLSLQSVTLADATCLYHFYSDCQVASWLSRLPWPFTSASAANVIVQATQDLTRGAG